MKQWTDYKYLPLFFLLTVAFLLAPPGHLNAQNKICQTEPAGGAPPPPGPGGKVEADGPYFLRIYVHVILDINGNPGQSEADVQEALAFLDAAFNPHNIFFVRTCETDFVPGYGSINGTPGVFSYNNHSDGIDVYLFPDAPWPVNNGWGYANGWVSTEFFVAGNFWVPPYNSIVRSQVISHEMGHCLGLYHTHDFQQLVNDPQCANGEVFTAAGDYICDTPADPYLDYDVDPLTCEWNSSGTDPNGDPYDPDEANIMAYSHIDCQTHFSAGQGAYMREKIETEPVLQACLLPAPMTNPTIAATTTWSAAEYRITGTLTVQSGASLTIGANTVVRFAPGGRLVVEQNALLTLYGTLTGFCGQTWQGVEVWGNSGASQFTVGGVVAQGRFVGRPNSLVENAVIGVRLWGPDFSTGGGGHISCTGTTFRNNTVGISTAPYANFWPFSVPNGWLNQPRNYFGTLSDCSFETNDQYLHAAAFRMFANLVTVNGFRFSGCDFINSRTIQNCTNIADYGFGIYAANSGFTVSARCQGISLPCTSFDRSLFRGLGYGIHAQTLGENRPFMVQQADFADCYLGILQREVEGSTIVNNDFYLGNVPNTGCPFDQVGVAFQFNTDGFTFQENDFYDDGGNVDNTIGTMCIALGEHNNLVRSNHYYRVDYGNIAMGNNVMLQNFSVGLHYECNTNEDITQYDFLIDNQQNQLNIARIRTDQGMMVGPDDYAAAGNKFSYTGGPADSDFRRDVGWPEAVRYHYHPTAANEEPLDFSNITPLSETEANPCEVEFCDPPCRTPAELPTEKDYFYTRKKAYNNALMAIQAATAAHNSVLAAQKRAEAAYARQDMDRSGFIVLLNVLYDTLTYHPDTLRTWLSNRQTYASELALAREYMAAGAFSQSAAVLSGIPAKFNLSPEDQQDLNATQGIYDMLAQKSMYALDQSDFPRLQGLAQSTMLHAAAIAQGLLELNGVQYFAPEYTLPSGGQLRGRSADPLPAPATEAAAEAPNLYPNPARNVAVLEWRSALQKDAVFTLSNASGQIVYRENISAGTRSRTIDVANLPKGVYLYRVGIHSGKLVIE